MISRADQPKRGRIFEIAIVVSVALHLLLGSFAMYRYPAVAKMVQRLIHEPKEKKRMVALSTAITIEKRTKPKPARPVIPQPQRAPARPQPRIVPHVATVPRPAIVPKELPAAKPTELARITPHGTPQPKVAARIVPPHVKTTDELTQQQLAEMQQKFAQTIAMAKAANDPTHVTSTAPPATMKRAHLDIEGINDLMRRGEGILTPRDWFRASVNGDSRGTCYYVDYQINFSDGQYDSGPVYWPICYPQRSDPFQNRWRGFPLPGPPPGWQPTRSEWVVIAAHPLLRLYFPDRFPKDSSGN
jgi:hypothetical protein